MLLSTKTTKHTNSFPQTVKLFGGIDMTKDCRNRFEVSNCQVVVVNYVFRKSESNRVKEINYVFV